MHVDMTLELELGAEVVALEVEVVDDEVEATVFESDDVWDEVAAVATNVATATAAACGSGMTMGAGMVMVSGTFAPTVIQHLYLQKMLHALNDQTR